MLDYREHAVGRGADAKAAAYVEARIGGRPLFGVGIDTNIVVASLNAVVSAANRAARMGLARGNAGVNGKIDTVARAS